MSDRFRPWSASELAAQIAHETGSRGSLFGIPLELAAAPPASLTTTYHHETVAAPVGVAAGPHSQLAGNIVAAWLCGARVIELKTVQVLDDIAVARPCIDMADAGYNVEWSQELTLEQSLEQYVMAWVLVHTLAERLDLPGSRPGVVFDVSVGYDLEGVRSPAIAGFLAAVRDTGHLIDQCVEQIAPLLPEAASITAPRRMASSVTLSTMHGCPPDEIERIVVHLMEECGLHTQIKLNPTLLGAERVRELLTRHLGWHGIEVPESTFADDLELGPAMELLHRLREVAGRAQVDFGVKLTNTLPVANTRQVLPASDGMMYMSGRPLHPLSVQVAALLRDAVGADLPISFCGGVDCWNVVDTLACGLHPVTVCSDLLRPGGYLRLPQYLEEIAGAMRASGAASLEELMLSRSPEASDPLEAAQANLRQYAAAVVEDPAYRFEGSEREPVVSLGPLGLLDCVAAPCQAECALQQDVPGYLRAIRDGKLEEAAALIRASNPLGAVLGRACDHRCERVCVRGQLDQPLAIRDLKRYALSHADVPSPSPPVADGSVAVLGAGPCGLSAASFLASAGHAVTVFDRAERPGGMVAATIPGFRADLSALDQDVDRLRALDVTFELDRDVTVPELLERGFDWVVAAVGAHRTVRLGLEGESTPGSGVIDGLELLRAARAGHPLDLGRRVVVVGGGDVAMDCARTAVRLGASVRILYRRTVREMPALPEELEGALEEGIELVELMSPHRTVLDSGRLVGVECTHMQLGEPDASGRRRPVEVPGAVSTVPADTLVIAVGQRPDLSCFGDLRPELTEGGWVRVDPETMATSVPRVLAGGDLAGDGPATIVRAAADGRRIAAAIVRQADGGAQHRVDSRSEVAAGRADVTELLRRRGRRLQRLKAPEAPVTERQGFEEVVQTYDSGSAVREASRCFECDRMCSICATVCPNRAIVTWRATSRHWQLSRLEHHDGLRPPATTETFAVTQALQQVVLADWCNECGNCATFCPADGRPYADKPRLVRSRDALAEEGPSAVWIGRNGERWQIEAAAGVVGLALGTAERFSDDAQGQRYVLEDDGRRLTLRGSAFPDSELWLDRDTLAPLETHGPGPLPTHLDLRTAAVLWVLLDGLREAVAPIGEAGGGDPRLQL